MSEKKDGPKMELTAMQLAAVLILEQQIAQLQIAANQLGGWLGLKREADILINAINVIGKDAERLKNDWATQVKIFPEAVLNGVIQGVK